MRRVLKSRRALSQVFTTVLLILLVVLGMGMLFSFFVSYTRDFQLGRGSAVLELVEIEDVWFRDFANSTCINITVYNYGEIGVDITSIYVDDVRQGDFSLVMQPGSHRYTCVWQFPKLSLNKNYRIKVVTARGSSSEGTYTTPTNW